MLLTHKLLESPARCAHDEEGRIDGVEIIPFAALHDCLEEGVVFCDTKSNGTIASNVIVRPPPKGQVVANCAQWASKRRGRGRYPQKISPVERLHALKRTGGSLESQTSHNPNALFVSPDSRFDPCWRHHIIGIRYEDQFALLFLNADDKCVCFPARRGPTAGRNHDEVRDRVGE